MSKESQETEQPKVEKSPSSSLEVEVVETKTEEKPTVAETKPAQKRAKRKRVPKKSPTPNTVRLKNLLPQALPIDVLGQNGKLEGRIIPTRGELEWPDRGINPSDFGPDIEVKVRNRHLIILR